MEGCFNQHGLARLPVTCVTAGKHGEVWIGTDHRGLYRYQDGKFTALNRQDGLAGDYVKSLFTDKDGGLWIGLEFTNCLQHLAEGRWRTFALPVVTQPVRTMAQDTKGNIWLGTGDGGLLRLEGEALVIETPRTLARGAGGPVLVGHSRRQRVDWIRRCRGGTTEGGAFCPNRRGARTAR